MSYNDARSPPSSSGLGGPSRSSLTASDDSSLLELSFGYEFDADGKLVRVSKPGARPSSPPTPADSYGGGSGGVPTSDKQTSASPILSHAFSSRVDALARSAAMLSTQDHPPDPGASSTLTGRSFTRVASGPAAPTVVHRPMRVPRATLDRHDEGVEDLQATAHPPPLQPPLDNGTPYDPAPAPPRRSPPPVASARYFARSASVSVPHPSQLPGRSSPLDPQVGSLTRRAGREKSWSNVEEIQQQQMPDTDTESEAPSMHSRSGSRHRSYGMVDAIPPALATGRPRRSASFSEAPSIDDPPLANVIPQRPAPVPPKRSQSSLDAYSGANRMPPTQYDDYSDIEPRNGRAQPSSPPNMVAQSAAAAAALARPHLSHTRKDSDTLRTLDPLQRNSPTARAVYAAQDPGRPASSLSSRRRPDTATPPGWGATERDSMPENGRRSRTPYGEQDVSPPHPGGPPSAAPVAHAASQPALAGQPPPGAPPQRTIVMSRKQVNRRCYVRLDLVGKGGSSRVYRVMSDKNEILAIKRVSLEKADPETLKGYMNEIGLLKRLAGNNRIIRLVDSEARLGAGGGKGHLHLVMECGEIDLARLLQDQQKKPMNLVWIAYYWEQMLDAVHIIHEEKIVHSDLKPANFVLVRGQLKLIDFGIANAIANDTTNIQRDHQIGTVNYMSPEAIEVPEGMRRLKVGRPSDVWSLGCILYQMVYGHPPFFHLSHVVAKMRAIPDPGHIIDFPEWTTPSEAALPGLGAAERARMRRRVRRDVIMSMRACLIRAPKERATIPELMQHEWLAMKEPEAPPPPDVHSLFGPKETLINPFYMHQLLMYGIGLGRDNQGEIDEKGLLEEAERLVLQLKQLQAETEQSE